MNEYILTITREHQNYRFKLWYKNGNFHRLERLSGFLPEKQYSALMVLVPQAERLLDGLATQYMNRGIVYEKHAKAISTHARFIDAYCQWYFNRFKIEVIIKPQDAAAIKFIKNALIKLSGSEVESLVVWQLILSNWDKQDTWYIPQTELTQIKRNLNIILKTLKHGKQDNKTQAGNVSDDFRKSL